MALLRHRFTYANVVSTIALFLVLGGGAAFAAVQLGKESVGKRELRRNAVTAAKIRAGAVGSEELADGSVTAQKLAPAAAAAAAAVPAGDVIVRHLQGTASLEFPPITTRPNPIPYPLENGTYTQAAGEDDLFLASVQVHFPASCASGRSARASLFIDKGARSGGREFIGSADVLDDDANDKTVTVQISPSEHGQGSGTLAPELATPHTFSLELVDAACGGRAGENSGITATGARIDVIGIR